MRWCSYNQHLWFQKKLCVEEFVLSDFQSIPEEMLHAWMQAHAQQMQQLVVCVRLTGPSR
jgi:hypothetical protein